MAFGIFPAPSLTHSVKDHKGKGSVQSSKGLGDRRDNAQRTWSLSPVSGGHLFQEPEVFIPMSTELELERGVCYNKKISLKH